jgi:hypothetical protein
VGCGEEDRDLGIGLRVALGVVLGPATGSFSDDMTTKAPPVQKKRPDLQNANAGTLHTQQPILAATFVDVVSKCRSSFQVNEAMMKS